MYGLRVAPKSWQEHRAEIQRKHNYKRGHSEASVFYYASDTEPVYSLVHVDDIIVVGTRSGHTKLRKILGDNFLVEYTGSLNHEGSRLEFLGRTMTMIGDEIRMKSSKGYVDGLLQILGLTRANGTDTTGSSTTKVTLDMDDVVSPESHSLYRTCVGKLQFMVPIRPDVAYATTELARDLVRPTNQSWNKLRHLGRYLQGTKDYVLVISPRM
jgi:hypothetical protein